jgi:hypothetical protein
MMRHSPHARRLILRVCHLAGTAAFIDEAGLGPEGKELRKAIRSRNTAALFDHLVAALSYQGISDEVAKSFMDRHGLASWHVIESALRTGPRCPKLRTYWHFYDCRYNKSRFTCAEPDRLADCPLPRSAGEPDHTNKEEHASAAASEVLHPAGRRRVRQATGGAFHR